MAEPASILFFNGNIHTVDDRRKHATWFTLTKDRFATLGEGPPPPARKSVDLKGKTVVPGFVDSHIHFFQTGLDLLFIDLAGVTSLGELADRLLTDKKGKRSWVFAQGFEEDKLLDASTLTRRELDRLFPYRPVWVNRVDYHSAIVNTAALRRLEVPAGTRGLMLEDGGEPSGVLRADAYMHAKVRVARQYPLWLREKAVATAVRACVRRGITAVHALEGGPLFGEEGVHAVLSKIENAPIDITLFLQEKNVYFTKKLGFEHLGGCILIDGSIGSYTAAVDDGSYADGSAGTLYENMRTLSPFVSSAHAAGAQLAFHAIGARAIEVVLQTYERTLQRAPRFDHRHRIEHFEMATDEQIQRVADLGAVVAMQPTFELLWGGPDGMYASRLGDAWKTTNRFRTILDAGIRIAGGSDANVTPPDPLLGMHAAVNRANVEQRVTPAEALRMMTLDSAYAAFNDTRHGSIAPGKEGSFVVLDDDPLTVAPETIRDLRVLETWSRGKCVHRAGETDPTWEDMVETV